ncbi:MAG: hypothetical protein WEE20_10000 [Bacteroidota bacterium]
MNSPRNTPLRYVSETWQQEIIGVPAIFMALGVFLLYPGKYIIGHFFNPPLDRTILDGLGIVLVLFALYVVARFGAQLWLDARVLWNFSPGHFRIGTWVAAVNIVAVVMYPIVPPVAIIAHLLAWLLWCVYMVWLMKMVVRGELKGGNLTGTVFLVTVATQSLVLGCMTVFAGHIGDLLPVLIVINVLGIIFYWISFALTWVVGGFVEPLVHWVPQNNITHGALSITMLAAQMIENSMPGSLPYFHFVIQAAWVITCLLLLLSLIYEVFLITNRKQPLLRFQPGNYARNFTYGMFFACSYYGYVYSHPSIMKTVMNPPALLTLGFLVLLVNAWEVMNHILTGLMPRTRLQGAR